MRDFSNLSIFAPILLLLLAAHVDGAKILFYLGIGSHSHRTAIEPLAHRLVAEGHNVHFFGPIPPTKPNPKFTQFCTPALAAMYKIVENQLEDRIFMARLENKHFVAIPRTQFMEEFTVGSCAASFSDPAFPQWLKTTEAQGGFDLVFVEHAVNICGYALGYYFKAPVILYSSTGFFTHLDEILGLPVEYSTIPHFALANQFSMDRTFYDKLYMTAFSFFSWIYTNYVIVPKCDQIVRDSFGMPEMPSIAELERGISLFFTNQYFENDYARSLPPFVVQLGGMHCDNWENKNPRLAKNYTKLPKEMEAFIAGEEGFVYVSFGTIISMSKAPEFLVNTFFDAVKDMNTKFLWKWDKNPPANLPKNVFTAKWFPQQDVLAHPKIRAFVTHGGLMSNQQSVCNGVPMITIPVLHDQPYNARTVELHGMGFHLELAELTTDSFKTALASILTDPKYNTNARKVQRRFMSRPIPPVELALHWTNYVLREGVNVSHLKPRSMNQSWWQRRLLDVWAFVLAILLLLSFLAFKILSFIIPKFFSIFTSGSSKLSSQKLKSS